MGACEKVAAIEGVGGVEATFLTAMSKRVWAVMSFLFNGEEIRSNDASRTHTCYSVLNPACYWPAVQCTVNK